MGLVRPPIHRFFSRSTDSFLFRLRIAASLFMLVVLIGVFSYMILLDLDLIQAFYYTVVTLTTVGYGDIYPRDDATRLFTSFFILGGFAVGYYSLSILLRAIIEGEIEGEIGFRRMQRKIDSISDHIVLCGFGRIGEELAANFAAESVPFVIIDSAEESFRRGEAAGYLMLRGDATSDETLRHAGIERARLLVPALASDVDNLFIVISARQLNANLNIIVRAQDESTAIKMKKAGADNIIRPLHIGAQHMAQACLRPTVLDFVQVRGRSSGTSYAIEEVPVTAQSALVEKSLLESNIRQSAAVILIGIKRATGDLVFNPSGETTIHSGDTLVAMGDPDQLDKLRKLAGGGEPHFMQKRQATLEPKS